MRRAVFMLGAIGGASGLLLAVLLLAHGSQDVPLDGRGTVIAILGGMLGIAITVVGLIGAAAVSE